MSILRVTPELLQSAAKNLATIQSALAEASASIAAKTTTLAPAAADEISTAVAAMFGNLGEEYQLVSAQAHAFHAEFVNLVNSSAAAYASAEIANVGATALPAAGIGDLLGGGLGSLLQGLFGGGVGSLLPGLFGTGSTSTTTLADFTGPYARLVSNTTANLQSLGNGLAANPLPFLRQFLTNQATYGQIISTSFANAIQDLSPGGAGPVAAFANLAPIGTIPGRIGQNALNLIRTITDTSYSVGMNLTATSLNIGPAFFGLPMAVGIDLIGSPMTTASAFGSSVAAFSSAVQSGNFLGAAAAVFTAPAVIADGFLNGQVTYGLTQVPISIPLLGDLPVTMSVPLGGILTPLSTPTLTVGPLNLLVANPTVTAPLGGTPTGGILPGLLLYLPQQLAQAIGAPAPVQPIAEIPRIDLGI